jgi:hypothetical protein
VRIVEVNWDITGRVSPDEALGILAKFRATFSDAINKRQMAAFEATVITVLSLPDSRSGGPVRRINGLSSVDGDTLIFKPFGFDDRIPGELQEVGGTIQIDIDCDYLMTRRGSPVSGSASPLIGMKGPFPPGGILRLSILIAG